MTLFLVTVAVTVLFAAIFLFLVAPGRPNERQKQIFTGRNIAHRGLFTADQKVPENSLAAYRAATEAGYGTELDVQLSRDGEVVVFHDNRLNRVCGVNKRVDELDLCELQKLSLYSSGEKIPRFSQALDVIGGKEPLVVELKGGKRNHELCEKTCALLKNYTGEYCIESFNPFIVRWFRRNAPDVFRGQLAQPPRYYKGKKRSKAAGLILGNTLFNFLARPQFIAYRIGKKPLAVRIAEKMGALRFAWTGHDTACEKDFDAVIFEHHRPKTKYK